MELIFSFLYHWRCRPVPPCSIILISTTKYQLDWKIILPGWSEFLSMSAVSCLPSEHQYLYLTGIDEWHFLPERGRPIQARPGQLCNNISLFSLSCDDDRPSSDGFIGFLGLNFWLQCSESLVLIIPCEGRNILSRGSNLLSFDMMWCLPENKTKH